MKWAGAAVLVVCAGPVGAAPLDGTNAAATYHGGAPVEASRGDLRVVLDSTTMPDHTLAIRVRGFVRGRDVFTTTLEAAPRDVDATIRFATLDKRGPQVEVESFTAQHLDKCCVVTKIATPGKAGSWTVLDGTAFNNGHGYKLEDIDGDGKVELIGSDQGFARESDFMGAATPYEAPIDIQKLEGTKRVSVSDEPRYRAAVAASLADMENRATEATWHDNGFLAAWVATKVLLGDGQAAWARMLPLYRHTNWFMCADPVPIWKCTKVRDSSGDFPAGLRRLLFLRGYIADENVFALPPGSRAPS